MPEKSTKKTNAAERGRRSLATRVFRSTLIGSVLLGAVAFAVGLGLYTNVLVRQYVGQATGVVPSAAASVRHGVDSVSIAREVMGVYRGLSAEERERMGTAEYRAFFSEVENSDDFSRLFHILLGYANSSGVDDVYLAMYDRETGALVYIADPDQNADTAFAPGEWERVETEEIERFLNWDGTGDRYSIGFDKTYGWICTAGTPLQDKESGETVAFILADVTLESVVTGMRSFVLQFTLAILLVTMLVAYFQTRRIKREVVQPINAIADAAERYVKDKQSGSAAVEHFAALNIRTGDEIENLSLVMADMERGLSEFEKKLTREVAEKGRIGAELSMAASIQAHMLPSSFPPFPDRSEFDLYATMHPAKEVGGDFYDFFMVDRDHLALVVSDVSGKGVPAALFSMIAKAILKMQTQTGGSPARVLREVNARLSENNDEDMFVTVWLGILEISTGMLTFADAGHEKPLLYHDGKWSFVQKHNGVALALLEPELLDEGDDPPFVDETLRLAPGDVLFQYTDGVPEATNAAEELFGDARLLDAINSAPSVDPTELLPHIRAAADAFAGGAPQFDDITMLALRLRGGADDKKA